MNKHTFLPQVVLPAVVLVLLTNKVRMGNATQLVVKSELKVRVSQVTHSKLFNAPNKFAVRRSRPQTLPLKIAVLPPMPQLLRSMLRLNWRN